MGNFDQRPATPDREARGIDSEWCKVCSFNSPGKEVLGEVRGAHLEEVGQGNASPGERV